MRPRRNEVPVEQTWNLEDLFPSRAAWEAERQAIEADLPTVTQYQGRLAEGAATLAAALKAFEALVARLDRWGTYAMLLLTGDGSDPENQALAETAHALRAQFMAATAFLKSEILALPEGQVEEWMAADPELAAYRPALEQILIERPYKLHPETEKALSALVEVMEAPYTIYERARAADMTFEPITAPDGRTLPVSFALYEEELELSADTAVRRAAFDSFTRGLKAYQNTFAATFATEVKKNVVLARLRGYESATHMLLAPHRIDPAVYHNLLDIIQAELAPHMRRYARLRKRVLGLDEMRYCDIEAPLDPEYNPKVTIEEARQLLVDALSVLGPEYREIVERAFRERWIDWADCVGKQAGAFCTSPYGVHSYILLTFTGNMRSVFTLAHELGHAGHFELANRHQRLLNAEPTLFFVEAPSTMNEVLLADHILKNTDDKRMRRWVITQLLMTYHHNFVRHLLEAELQRRIYAQAEKGVPITAQLLSETKGAILEEFWGGEVVIDEGARLTWMRQPHYYMGLYSYTYSAGLTCGTAVAQRIKEEGQPAAEQWLEVLKLGGSLPPLELMARAGVDMTKPDPIRKAVAYVGALIDELEASF